jgi:hypothetical protein
VEGNPLQDALRHPQLDVDSSGHAVIAAEKFPDADPDAPQLATAYYDVAGAGAWGTFLSSSVPNNLSIDPTVDVAFPRIKWQTYDGQTITHILCYEEDPDGDENEDRMSYWRKVGDGTGGTWTTQIFADSLVRPTYTLAASRVSGKVAIVYAEFVSSTLYNDAAEVYYYESTNAGATWPADPVKVINIDVNEEGWCAWLEACGMYDTDDYLHVAYYASRFRPPGGMGGRTPCRIFHWSERTGLNSVVAICTYDLTPLCGVGGYATLNVAKVVLSQCNDKLYTLWTQYGNTPIGDTNDCASETVLDQWNAYNAEIYMSISSDLDGVLWDAQRNLTNSHTPGCDTVVANDYPCDHDTYPTMPEIGYNGLAMGGIYWDALKGDDNSTNAFQLRDALAPSWPDDGWYLDVQYLNDFMPDEAYRGAYDGSDGIYTNNPVKWFRLPCIDPIIKPRIWISQDDFLHPFSWVKAGQSYELKVVVENFGNEALAISNVTLDPSGADSWLRIDDYPTSIEPAGHDTAYFTLNHTSSATPAAIEADIIFHNSDYDDPEYEYVINTIIADTVNEPRYDTVATGHGFGLSVATNGNAGNSGFGGGGICMDFVNFTPADCDDAQTVYLYDLTPVIMKSESNYSWGPFFVTDDPTRWHEWNFQPVPDGKSAKESTGDDFNQFQSGSFVTSDSTIGCNKIWVAVADPSVTYMIEKWEIYSYDGGTYNDVRISEWIDWDIPSASGANNEGYTVSDPGHVTYVYQQGIPDLAAEDPPCLSEDRRLGGSGLLGYYTTTEKASDPGVNHTDLFGGFVQMDDDIFPDGSDDNFLVDSAWAFSNRTGLYANNADEDDQQSWLSFGSFDIVPDDTLCIWIVHASVYDGDDLTLQAYMSDAEAWYLDNRDEVGSFGCCGSYGNPGYTGNTNCSLDGLRTLADITRLIDRVYITKEVLCCEENGNVNGSTDGLLTLADITALIDHVYIKKEPTAPCL